MPWAALSARSQIRIREGKRAYRNALPDRVTATLYGKRTNMKPVTRRKFCTIAAALGASAVGASHRLLAQTAALPVSLSIDPLTKLASVPTDFMGLSYESGQLVYPDYFSGKNTALIDIFKRLSPAGVLRLGGNLSEFTAWSETEPAIPPEPGGLVGPDPGHREPRTFTITPRSIRNLQGFPAGDRLELYLWAQPWSWHSGTGGRGGQLRRKNPRTEADLRAVRQ